MAVLNDETSLVLLEDAAGHERPDCATLDSGAPSFLMAKAIGMTSGMTVKTFGFETGWNFTLQSHQRAFLELQDQEMPDEIYLSPSCGPWSRMQNISATSEQRKEVLRGLRDCGTTGHIFSSVSQAVELRATRPHRAANLCPLLGHCSASLLAWLSCSTSPMPIWRRLYGC